MYIFILHAIVLLFGIDLLEHITDYSDTVNHIIAIVTASIIILISLGGIYGVLKCNECCCRLLQILCIACLCVIVYIAASIPGFGGYAIFPILIYGYFAWVIHRYCTLVCFFFLR